MTLDLFEQIPLTMTRWVDDMDMGRMRQMIGAVNADPVHGFPSETLLCCGCDCDQIGGRWWQVWSFAYRRYAWNITSNAIPVRLRQVQRSRLVEDLVLWAIYKLTGKGPRRRMGWYPVVSFADCGIEVKP